MVVLDPSVRTRHDDAVDRLLASYAAVPPGEQVRLAKRTSNLFRPRGAATRPGLDVSGLGGVLAVDHVARTADVQGVCTYEHLVDATLPHGLAPLVVPQLRTITLGGAVTGLGIESTSFRHGLPHESVLEMDVLTGAGEVVTARPDGEHADLFAAFPNSYGTLGYATRLRVELHEVGPAVLTRNVRFTSLDDLQTAVDALVDDPVRDGEPVHFLDGVVFSADESYLVLGRSAGLDEARRHGPPSDWTGQVPYYRSLQRRETDQLTAYDYLWRWDTDWFWCSRAFGAQHPLVRPLWPRRYRRSDVYHRIVGFEHRHHLAATVDRWRGRPARERVVQDVEVPVERTADFLRWFLREVPITPIWLCPLRLRGGAEARTWPLYPLEPGRTYVNVGFWGTVPVVPPRVDGDVNRLVEREVTRIGGHKSLYSDAYYSRDELDRLYGGSRHRETKERYDPQHRLPGLFEKVVGRR